MRYGLFSDVHSNLEAMEKVLSALAAEQVDRYVFVGDIVGYGADPRACVSLLKNLVEQKGCLSVAGNHDHAVCGLTPYANYSESAQRAIEWTKGKLDKDTLDFLASFPLMATTAHFSVAHANFFSPAQWQYVFDIDDAEINFKAMKTPVGFVGHSHSPVVFRSGEMVDSIVDPNVGLQENEHYIINVGSVGQPRDGDPRAAFVVYDATAQRVEIKRVSYDVDKAQAKIREAGLPRMLADRLAAGK